VSEEPSSLEFFRTGMNKSEAQDDGKVVLSHSKHSTGEHHKLVLPYFFNTNKNAETFCNLK
jgi:hypothetical protein